MIVCLKSANALGYIRSCKSNEPHLSYHSHKKAILSSYFINFCCISYICLAIFHYYCLFNACWNSKKWRITLLRVHPRPITLLLIPISLSLFIILYGLKNSLLKHLIQDIVVLNSYIYCPLDKNIDRLQRC